MLSKKIEKAFNGQVNAEYYSSYLYLSMAACFEAQNLKGMAQWMRIQAQEEMNHVMKFFDFINDRGGKVRLASIEAPAANWNSPLATFEAAYEHERKVTGSIDDLLELSMKEKDHAASTFLQWFVTEQVEEEANVSQIVENLKLAGDNKSVLYMIDKELGQRTLGSAG